MCPPREGWATSRWPKAPSSNHRIHLFGMASPHLKTSEKLITVTVKVINRNPGVTSGAQHE